MEPRLSIQVAWPLAAKEAIAAEFQCIEPAHLFLATLKFAELEERQIERLVDDSGVIKELISDRDEVRSRLRGCSIEVPDRSRGIRYGLRKRMGRGNHPYDGQRMIHRSATSREIFRKAEASARAIGTSKWSVLHLLDMLFESPSPEMTDVLADAGISGPKGAIETPYLDRYGRDLSALAAERRRHGGQDGDTDIARDPVCKVVIDDILGTEKKNILLIQKGKRSPKEIVEGIAGYFAGESAPPGARGKRVVELEICNNAWESSNVSQKELEKKIRPLFHEIIEGGNIVLFINEFHKFLVKNTSADFSGLLKDLLSNEQVRCIVGVDEDNYHKCLERDKELKKFLRPVWIHDLEVLSQL